MNYENNSLHFENQNTINTEEAVAQDSGAGTEKRKPSKKELIVNYMQSGMTVICFLAQIVVATALLLGSISAFYLSVNPITAIDFAFKLFAIAPGKIYYTVAKIAIAVFYVVTLVLVIKNLIKSTAPFTAVLKNGDNESKDKNLDKVYRLCTYTLSHYFLFAITCFVLTGDAPSYGTVTIAAFGIAVYLIINTLLSLHKRIDGFNGKDDIIAFAFEVLTHIFYCVLLSMLAAFMLQPSGANIAASCVQLTFGGSLAGKDAGGVLSIVYEYFAKDILFIAAAVIYYKLLVSVIESTSTDKEISDEALSEVKKRTISILTVIGISALISCFLSALNSGVSTISYSTITSWFAVLKLTFLPTIAILIALFVLTNGKAEKNPA